MHIRPVIPVKSLPHSKSRLQEVLPPSARQALTCRLLRRLLAVLQTVSGLGTPLVVSRDTAVAQLTHTAGAEIYCEPPTADLNQALHAARAHLQQHDPATTHLLILPSDLPLVEPEDIRQLLLVAANTIPVVMVSDQRQTGTNALLLPTTAVFNFHYGPHSFQKHQQEAQRRHLPYAIHTLPRLQFDLDTAQDWQAYQNMTQPAPTNAQ